MKPLCILFFFFTTLVLSQTQSTQQDLKIYDSTQDWRHFDYSLNEDHTLRSWDNTSIVVTTFPVKIIENKFLKVTLLPAFGGRILSVIYKPTGHDLLYQNPSGTPYGIGKKSFYYNFLMVYGGIFPTFPEPEHGKTWDLPWDFEVVENTSDKISVEMSFTDSIAPYVGIPPNFTKGVTDLTCVVTVTVYSTASFVEYDVKLVNNRNRPVDYEFWTCMTFAPGSTPGDTRSNAATEIYIPVEQLKIELLKWAWMGNAEAPIDVANGIMEFKNLRWYKNWQDRGIAYAYPQSTSFYGVINHDNEEGVMRITEDPSVTPGIKLWTWGFNQGMTTPPETPENSRRPYIELWSGRSKQFFTNATMEAGATSTWKEFFVPTVGLDKITYANQYGAVYVECEEQNDGLSVTAKVFSTMPDQTVRGSLQLVGTNTVDVVVQQWNTSDTSAYSLQGSLPLNSIANGSYQCQFVLHSENGDELMSSQVSFVKV